MSLPFFSAFERMVAFRYLRARRQEGFISVISWFSLLGIGLGVATLIVVMSVMNGFRAELFARVLGMNGHMSVTFAQGGPLVSYGEIMKKILTTDGVKDVSPIIEGQTLITKDGVASGAMVRGVLPSHFAKRDLILRSVISGALDHFGGDGIAIGSRMAARLGVHVGDTLTLIAPTMKSTVFGTAPRMKAYPIAVIYNVGMFEYDNNFIFMPLEAAQLFFRMGSGVSALEIFVKEPHRLEETEAGVKKALAQDVVDVVDWRQSNASFFNALQVERNVMFLILTLIIIVAAFNIISGLIMLVKDKGSDIAILRTMGATRGMVMRIFFLSGASIGLAGTLFGLILGVLVAKNIENVRQFIQGFTHTDLFSAEIYFLTHLPSELDWREVAQVVCMSLGLSFLATLYPSWRAAKLDPVEALRYE